MRSVVLELRNVSKIFGGLKANQNVSFSIGEREIMGLIGPNGAGKTTLFNCITGFYPPTSGEVLFKGKVINELRPFEVCRLGMVRTWQKVRPLTKLSVLENVIVGALCRTNSVLKAEKIAREKIAEVGLLLKINANAGGLPIGERKKLEVARALATEPELVLLDEVMGGLNPKERDEMIRLILKIRDSGRTLMVIEHDMKAIMRISDRVVVLNGGLKLVEGLPLEVANHPAVIEAYLGKAHA